MSDRLSELQRQRALAQEQLAWLDREIARESGQAPAAPAPLPATPAAPVAAAPREMSAAAARAADEIIAQYQTPPGSTAKNVKRGCYAYFFVALGTFLLVVGTIYLFYLRRQ
ncbi:hypothetical protein [Opitutus sp. GAS368]|uniref:hypothetical protein n=1 Tax=Opitutus sp. GAS368 TaxID=1882749 RepID=UPI00087A635F|nr:hypothetical protein [Opitutus sp. GAS368]SDS56197.1 hypothetical protein SAMN05444173_3261 [Opitutus sp. GAS368]